MSSPGSAGSPLDRIEADLDYYEGRGDLLYTMRVDQARALVDVARAAEEAAQFSRPTEAQMHALRSALSRLRNQHA